jgi:hypothetical protein
VLSFDKLNKEFCFRLQKAFSRLLGWLVWSNCGVEIGQIRQRIAKPIRQIRHNSRGIKNPLFGEGFLQWVPLGAVPLEFLSLCSFEGFIFLDNAIFICIDCFGEFDKRIGIGFGQTSGRKIHGRLSKPPDV